MRKTAKAQRSEGLSSIINKAGGEVTVQLISDAHNDSFSDYYREYEDLTLSKLKKDINAFYRGGGVREISQFYQRAFAGSRVDYDRPSLEAIGTGEGNQAHGWGLYYALDKDVAEKYREDFERDNYFFDEDKLEVERQKQEKSGNFNKTELLEDLLIHHDESNLGNFSDEVVDWYRKEIRPNVLNKNYRKTQVHEVEIPENPFLLDEQLPFSEQSEFVKEKLQELLHDNIFSEYVEEGQTLDDFVETEIIDWELGHTGGNIYDRLSNLLGSDQSASSFLEKYGIKGISYDGKEDGRAFVIFNPDDVEVIQKFYQGQIADNGRNVELTINSQEDMQGLSDEDFKNKMLKTLKSFKGKKIPNKTLKGDIEIRTSSIKKYKSFFADKNKRLLVPYIPELLEKARFISENTYTPETEKNIVAYWKADLLISIDKDTYNVHLTVKEDDKGNFFWDAQVNEEARRTVSATNPSVGGLTSEISEDALNITPIKENVNNTD